MWHRRSPEECSPSIRELATASEDRSVKVRPFSFEVVHSSVSCTCVQRAWIAFVI